MTTRFIITVLCLMPLLAFGQQSQNRPVYQVKGQVLEAGLGHYPLEYATLVFTPKKGKITGGISDSQGYFNIDVPAGEYRITIEFISFKTKYLSTKKITSDLDLGKIYLEPNVESLDEVEIIAEKSTVDVKLDKKIYNVGQDMTVKGGNASDVLENVPSVTVDVEGNVSLRGNESVRILINGKPSGLVGINPADALKQLPADAVQQVEVITSPSARYDAEGTAGIINIILRKGKADGFNASVTLKTGYPHNHGISSNLNYRVGNFNVFSNLGYNYRNTPGEATFFNYVGNKSNKLYEEFRTFGRVRHSLNTNIGVEYFITDNTSITGSYLYKMAPGERDNRSNGKKYDANHLISLTTFRQELEEEKDFVNEYAFNFTQKFKTDGHQLTVDVKLEDDFEDEASDIIGQKTLGNDLIINEEQISNVEKQKELIFQSDYTLPIGDKHHFEAGTKMALNNNNIDYQLFDYKNNLFVLNDDVSNVMLYNEDVYAAYVQYGAKFDKFSVLGGLRVENTKVDVNVAGTPYNYNKDYTRWFPTLNVSYAINETANITLGYNKRIRRPRSRHLNPFPSRSSEANIFQGNPNLDPVISDAYDIGFYKKWTKFSLNTSVYYNEADNAFQMVRYNTGDKTSSGVSIIKATPINLNTEQRMGYELSLTYNPARRIRLNNAFNIFKYKSEGHYNGTDYLSDDISWFNRFSAKVGITKKSDFQTNFFYMGPTENSENKRSGIFMANAAYSLDFWQDNATLTFNVSDIFNSRYREMISYYDDFNSSVKMQWRKRQFTLSLTYRFNQKKKMQHNDRNSDEDDGDEMM